MRRDYAWALECWREARAKYQRGRRRPDEMARVEAERDKFMWQVRDTCARAEKAEAEVASLKDGLAQLERWAEQVCNAADDFLAPVCAEAGRVMYDMPDEDMVPHLPPLKAKLFRALYEATDRERVTCHNHP